MHLNEYVCTVKCIVVSKRGGSVLGGPSGRAVNTCPLSAVIEKGGGILKRCKYCYYALDHGEHDGDTSCMVLNVTLETMLQA